MSVYLDASAAVASIVREDMTERVIAWIAAQPIRSVRISAWVETEVASALSQKVRGGFLKTTSRPFAERRWDRLRSEAFTTIGVMASDFQTAVRFMDDHRLGLRAGDALHLAIAARLGLSVATLDAGMASAANALGIPTIDL